ncbi:MAG TPA: ABC transporter permease, partial [Clostridia bacterium]|nr:ABC transporter permease [Clostridia bacterium]
MSFWIRKSDCRQDKPVPKTEKVSNQAPSFCVSAWADTLWQDIRYGARKLFKNPGFTAIVVLTLAVGIGVNTSIFSVVSGVLLRPVNFPELARLVQVKLELVWGEEKQETGWLRFEEVSAWTKNKDLPLQVAAHTWLRANLTDRNEAERVTCGCVSAGMLSILGVRPMMGRDFLQEDDRPGAPPVAILSHQLWL